MVSGVTSSARRPSHTKMMTLRGADPPCCGVAGPPPSPSTTNDTVIRRTSLFIFMVVLRFLLKTRAFAIRRGRRQKSRQKPRGHPSGAVLSSATRSGHGASRSRSPRRVSGTARRRGASDVADPEDQGPPRVPRAAARAIASSGETGLLAVGGPAGAAGEAQPPPITLHAAEGHERRAIGLADRWRDRRPEPALRRRGRRRVRAPGRRRHADRPRPCRCPLSRRAPRGPCPPGGP